MDENIDERLDQLVESGRRFGKYPFSSPSPKIQRVSHILRQNPHFAKYCSPKIISFGPIHHRRQNLKLGQRFKNFWTYRYVEECNRELDRCIHSAFGRIQENIGELKKFFSDDVLEGYAELELSWMLFVDGCSLLYYMDKVDRQRPENLGLKLDQLMHTWRDILLLENQLPVRVLELLSKKDGNDLDFLVSRFVTMGSIKRAEEKIVTFPNDTNKPTHIILDSCRAVYVDTEDGLTHVTDTRPIHIKFEGLSVDSGDVEMTDGDESNEMTAPAPAPDTSQFWRRYKNIRDLKPAGIRVKAFPSSQKWQNIGFSSTWFGGELKMPMFIFNDGTLCLLCNMIAYEMCPDFRNNFGCCSYFSFMDSLIDDAEDVKELRLAGVFENLVGTDEELAKFFNEIGRDLPTQMSNYIKSDVVAYSEKYVQVKREIQDHYRKKWKWWLAEARDTYFKSPWSVIALLAATVALVLSIANILRPKS